MQAGLSFILLTWCHSVICQPSINDGLDIEESVYETIMDTINSWFQFGYYNPDLFHYDTRDYAKNPLDSFIIWNPETYEEVEIQGVDLIAQRDSINAEEAKLFKERLKYPYGVSIVVKINKEDIHNSINLKDYLYLEHYPDIKSLYEFNEDICADNKIGDYDVFLYDEKDTNNLKYVVKAYFLFSGVIWDINNEYCLVECGYHYRFNENGTSGGGFQAILKRRDNNLEILKTIGLWTE